MIEFTRRCQGLSGTRILELSVIQLDLTRPHISLQFRESINATLTWMSI